MEKLIRIFIFSFVLFCSGFVSAQDIHFTQMHSTPLFVNPALTGLFKGDIRVAGIYRSQWRAISSEANFSTTAVSVDGKIMNLVGNSDWLAAGIAIYTDAVGTAGYRENYFDISAAYNLSLGTSGNTYASFGAQAGINQRRFDMNSAQFGNQYGGLGYDGSLDSGENFQNDGANLFNLSAGGIFYQSKSKRQYNFAGIGFYYLAGSGYSFSGVQMENIPMKMSIQAGTAVQISSFFDLVPGFNFLWQSNHYQINTGNFFRFVLAAPKRSNIFRAISVGPFVRLTGGSESGFSMESLMIATKVDFDDLSVGVSYDFTLSDLSEVNSNRGAFELSLVYTPWFREASYGRGGAMTCPRF